MGGLPKSQFLAWGSFLTLPVPGPETFAYVTGRVAENIAAAGLDHYIFGCVKGLLQKVQMQQVFKGIFVATAPGKKK